MTKGISVKFKSYQTTIPALLKLIKLDEELKKHDRIVLKPFLRDSETDFTPVEFTEAVLNYCIANKKAGAEIVIAEGSDGEDTQELFAARGYKALAEKYAVGLVDLNSTENQEINDYDFLKFAGLMYPKILLDSFVISMPKLFMDDELEMVSSLSNMIGAYPASHYRGLLTKRKNRLRKYPAKFAVHDILKCKLPNLAIIDASEQGFALIGKPYETDKQAAKVLGKDWRSVSWLKLFDESFKPMEEKAEKSK